MSISQSKIADLLAASNDVQLAVADGSLMLEFPCGNRNNPLNDLCVNRRSAGYIIEIESRAAAR